MAYLVLLGFDLQRASAANILYAFCAEVLELCCKLGKLFMSENPRNSLFWLTTTKLAGTEANGRNGPDLQPISNRLQQWGECSLSPKPPIRTLGTCEDGILQNVFLLLL